MHASVKCLSLVLLFYIVVTVQAYKSYDGYQVLRTEILNASSVTQLSTWLQQNPEYDTWSPARVTSSADIMTSPKHVSRLKYVLNEFSIKYSVFAQDVGRDIANEKAQIEKIKQSEQNKNQRAPSFERFLTYDEIQAYITEVSTTYPNIASLIDIGTSHEGRPMRVLKLSNGPGKTGIWFDAAIHAREWAAPPVALYAINELTENLSNNQAMLDKNDFYFLPVANPDGYSFTWTDDRFWRKTRSPNSVCVGTDANRNFDSHWGEGGDGPCSDTYPGSEVFSEPEIKAMSDFLLNETSITFYTALHSYGKLILSPYSYTINHPDHYDQMMLVGNEAAQALRAVRGTKYDVGSSADILYYSYGNSKDWAYDGLGVEYSFTIELPGGGSGSFNPPPEDILPVVTETWEAIKVFAANIPAKRRW